MSFASSTLHINVPLTDFALAFRPDLNGYMWSRLLPQKFVTKRSDLIRGINKGELLRKHDLRVRGSGVQEVQYKVDPSQTFSAVDYAVQTIHRNTERMEADEILQHDAELMLHSLVAMHTNLEVICVKETLRNPALLTQGVNLGTNAANQWDNYASPNANPIEDLIVACGFVRRQSGKKPNLIVMHNDVWTQGIQLNREALARSPIHPSGSGIFTLEMLAEILNVDRSAFVIHDGQYNVAPTGSPDEDFRSFMGPDVIVAYVDPASPRSFGLGTTFMFQDRDNGGSILPDIEAPFLVYEFPDNGLYDARGAMVHRIVGSVDFKILKPECGYLIRNAVDGTNTARYGNYLNN